MTARYVEAMAHCSRCGNPVPLNAVVSKTPCPSCESEVAVDSELWTALTAAASGRRAVSTLGSAVSWEVEYDSVDCGKCPACDATFQLPDLIAHAPEGGAPCGSCGARILVRPVPREIASGLPLEAGYLVGEDAATVEGRLPAPAKGDAVTVHCQACGAPISADGSSRTATCTFCHARSVLSDEIWRRLRPVPTKRRFYYWVDEEAIERRERAQIDEAATRDRASAPGCLVWALIATVPCAVGGRFALAHADLEHPGIGAVGFGALFLAFIGAVFAMKFARTISGLSEDASTFGQMGVGLVGAGIGLMLHFVAHWGWLDAGMVIGTGLTLTVGPIFEAAWESDSRSRS